MYIYIFYLKCYEALIIHNKIKPKCKGVMHIKFRITITGEE